jgi:allophanate hydrolase subunit 2
LFKDFEGIFRTKIQSRMVSPVPGQTATRAAATEKNATVISADLPKLEQIKPGDRVRFRTVSLDASRHALQAISRAFISAVSALK